MNFFLTVLTILFLFPCFSQLTRSQTDSAILSTFKINSSFNNVALEFGKGEKIECYYSKRRLIPRRYPKNAVGCGTAIGRYRYFKTKKNKRYFDEVIYLKSPFHVYLYFENDSLKTIKVLDTTLRFDNNLKIGDSLKFPPQNKLIENLCTITYFSYGSILNNVIYSSDKKFVHSVIVRRKREYRIS